MQFLALKLWGRLSDAFGNRLILQITSVVLPILPPLWLWLPSFWSILAIQMLAGVCWAGFSLASGNFLYDVAPAAKRANYGAMHQTLSNGAIVCGALIGGLLGTHAPDSIAIGERALHFSSGLWAALLVSGVARAVVAATLLPRLREVRTVRPMSATTLVARFARVNVLVRWLPWRTKTGNDSTRR
jgi:MFS family permease